MKRIYDEEKYGYLVKARQMFEHADLWRLPATRLFHCTAWYYTDDNGWIWLKSYNTIVAVYVPEDDTVYSFGRYSSTTYQHVRKFSNMMPSYYRTNEVNIEYENWY